jgi:hypothetical protein
MILVRRLRVDAFPHVHDLPAQAHDEDDNDDDDDDGHKLKRWSRRLEDWPSLRSRSESHVDESHPMAIDA